MAIAHRGASAYAPENTLAAFGQALRLGCHAVEFDVRLSRDRVPVVIHDATVDRTTNGRGAVRNMSVAELQRLDAGAWFGPQFAGARVPTLDEALAAVAAPARCAIELKEVVEPAELIAALERSGTAERAVITSFEPGLVAPVRRACRDVAVGLLASQWD